jgi:hypothetical protein
MPNNPDLHFRAPRSAMMARANADNANLVENENQFP